LPLQIQCCKSLPFVFAASLAVWQRVTVMEGKTLTLRCPITNAHQSHVEWKNPKGYVMFFNHNKALKDRRYSIDKLSKTEFTVSVSDITFKDGGNYTCLHYNHTVTEKTVEVTVLGYPKIAVARHGGRKVIKCTAAANHYAPKIFWQIGHVIETAAQPHIITEDNISKYVSVDKLHVQSVRDKVRVKCLVRHPALHSEPLMDFVDIGRPGNSPTTQPQRSTTTHWFERESTTETPATTDLNGPTMFPQMTSSPMTQPDHPGTTSILRKLTVFLPFPEGFDERQKRAGNEGNSSLLVFLVTCLIFALLVVVLFFAIKLRRAHILWKRENEDSAPSEESSKSKSSQEERLSQAQRRKGLFNIGFTKYVIEEPTEIITETNTTMTTAERKNKEPTSALHVAPKTEASASNHIKETEL
uniref:Ig-like domain-containing protein n=1 Tax=Myripristis murdjan TaxID=586833 RepID=A0A667ZEJ0_9TELE